MSGSDAPAKAAGRLFVIAAPSGAGKTSLVRALMTARAVAAVLDLVHDPQAATERGARRAIITSSNRDEFERMVAAGEFLEHAQVFDNYYGTLAHARSRRRSPRART